MYNKKNHKVTFDILNVKAESFITENKHSDYKAEFCFPYQRILNYNLLQLKMNSVRFITCLRCFTARETY